MPSSIDVAFRRRLERINWRQIASINLDKVTQEVIVRHFGFIAAFLTINRAALQNIESNICRPELNSKYNLL
jgi:hypothetical protein